MCLVCSLLAIKHIFQARRSSVCALRIPARLSLFDSYKEVCIKWLCRDFVCKWCFQEVSWINESKTLIQENGGSNNLTVEGSGHSIRAYPLVSWQGNLTMWILLQKIENLYFRFVFSNKLIEFKALPQGFRDLPRIFTKILKPVLAHLHKHGHTLIYIDWRYYRVTHMTCLRMLCEIRSLCLDVLGFTVPSVRILSLHWIVGVSLSTVE